ncbi:glycosyltransferase 87 family protein [Pilimelia columellifera]|uniref:Glycosyltransferase 87 family protein n=1 Tax=Pilimelia columellifera subsp. columellifera TaxID=706583 RepID=A0ABN3NGV1_9ACTN
MSVAARKGAVARAARRMLADDRRTALLARWLWAVAGVAFAVHTTVTLLRPARQQMSDLGVYIGSVNSWLSGRSLYDFAAVDGAPFTYPPFAGVLFLPTALLPAPVTRVLWLTATAAAIVALSLMAGRRLAPVGVPPALAGAATAAALALSAPVSSNVRFGQVSVLLVALVLADVAGVLPRPLRGVGVGVAAAVKLTPIIFILGFVVVRRWRPLAWRAAATFVVATAVTWWALPAESERFWLVELWHVERIGNLASTANQSLNGALLRLGLTDQVRVPTLAALGAVALALALARARRLAGQGRELPAMVVLGAASLVLSPVSWTHHGAWLVLAAGLAAAARWRWWWTASTLAVMTLPVATIPFPPFSEARLLLAAAVAVALPLGTHVGRGRECQAPSVMPLAASDGRSIALDQHVV